MVWRLGIDRRVLLDAFRTSCKTLPRRALATRPSAAYFSSRPHVPKRPFVPIPRRLTRRIPETEYPYAPGQRRHYLNINPNDPRIRNARPIITAEGLRRFGRSRYTRTFVAAVFLGALLFYVSNLETVPVSGRTRFNCYSRKFTKQMAGQQIEVLLGHFQSEGKRVLEPWDSRTRKVRRVLDKLIPFSGMVDEEWEVFVIDDPGTVNAAAMPGGKVIVHTGLFRVARSDADLAAVLGHEVAHVLADHVGERLSQRMGRNLLFYSLLLLSAPFGGGPMVIQLLGMEMLDLVFDRPMTRRQETEADYVGLMMMAEACYDPRKAIGFWQRMARLPKEAPPEWLSTHPSDASRVRKMQEWLPKAMEKQSQSDCATTNSFADLFQRALREGRVIDEYV